jgi:sulfatase modifying factor 1
VKHGGSCLAVVLLLTLTGCAPAALSTLTPAPTRAEIQAVHPEMVRVEAGSFQMGAADGPDNERPVHMVHLTRSFLIAKHEVTLEEYDRFCDDVPGRMRLDDHGWGRGQRPVTGVTWSDAVAYCNWLSEKEGLTPAYSGKGKVTTCDFAASGYRLPTEAEWEYAARGGPQSAGFSYAGGDDPNEVAWYGQNSSGMVQPVGLKKPNELGVFDMSGNAWEWCWDWYDDGYYAASPADDPRGPLSGTVRARRSGACGEAQNALRVSFRSADAPSYAGANGFRLVRTASPE